MTTVLTSRPAVSPLRAAAGLAAAMGVGRFVYTPLMPVMISAGRIDARAGATIAAANYAGYLIGAVLLARRPDLNGRTAFRTAAATLILSEALMAWPAPAAVAAVLRLIAGIASAVLFIGCASVAAGHENRRRAAGIAFGGIGGGIALTGLLAMAAGTAVPWQVMWLGTAALTALLLAPALRLEVRPATRAAAAAARSVRAWRLLQGTYFLEGLGYIVIGTFLVAALQSPGHRSLGTAMWVVVGVAAAPATLLWDLIARRWFPEIALVLALALQCVSAILPAASTGMVSALISAALFGATFTGITMLAIEVGGELTGPGAAATLTAGYGLGQVLGPLVVTPALGDGYGTAFAIAAVILAVATAGALRIKRT
ncbi:YbfB/YjiJ family MFS transporter [Nocardia jiangxiensis]|uniref:YbfB/YjiJ family MFS transporter n=1 Tax=Nocardia jiangxiensis TaxID=282685 RepID=UPI0002F487CF|nr:YbfB/YjiJ family MFS transporter [Nocardia jiangxiensis]